MSDKLITQDTEIKSFGDIFVRVENLDGSMARLAIKNKVLRTGKNALAKVLANDYTGPFKFYIARVLFGNSGTIGGSPRLVEDTRTGLFGPVVLAKPVLATVNEDSSQVTFTTTITFAELVNQTINEMALEMADGDLFSMTTFGDVTKTSTMQIVWNWRLTWV